MSSYTRERGRDFWYDFDNQTLWRRTAEIDQAIGEAYGPLGGLDGLVDLFRFSYSQASHPAPLVDRISPNRNGFLRLADAQVTILRSHFVDDVEAIRDAFIDFGQGVLYDDRDPRPLGRHVHMMDGSPEDWVGYHRWHAFGRSAMLLGGDGGVWLQLCRFIALAWAIQSEAEPAVDSQTNPGLPAGRVTELADFWLAAPAQILDRAFVTYRTRAPRPDELTSLRLASFRASAQLVLEEEGDAGTHYAQVSEILERATGTGRPFHGNHKRFWTLPLSDFLKITTIYNVELIAAEGPDRGARSGLIKALKGEPPFGPGGKPRMPLNRPPVPDDEIAYIQKWMDQGCPE
jgi:hypothetical protein